MHVEQLGGMWIHLDMVIYGDIFGYWGCRGDVYDMGGDIWEMLGSCGGGYFG